MTINANKYIMKVTVFLKNLNFVASTLRKCEVFLKYLSKMNLNILDNMKEAIIN